MTEYKFEKFTDAGAKLTPKISIRRNGVIGISQGALAKAFIQSDEFYAILNYDKAQKVIGIFPTKNKDEEGAVKIVYQTKKDTRGKDLPIAYISAKTFLNLFDIPFETTRSYPAKWDEHYKMLIVNLGEKTV